MIKPIKPEEILDKKAEVIPAAIFQAVNELIALKWNGSTASFKQKEVIAKYFELCGLENNEKNRSELFDNHALDIEDIYRREGWHVYYDKPGYNENYEPTFQFSIRKKLT